MRSAWVASFLAAVLVAAGCAQEDDAHRLRSLDVTASPAQAAADEALADSTLLTLDDFPARWRALPRPEEITLGRQEKADLARCLGADSDVFDLDLPHAGTPTFVSPAGDTVTARVSLAADDTGSRRSIEVLRRTAAPDCYAEAAFQAAGAFEPDGAPAGVEVGTVSAVPIPYADFGNTTVAWRMSVPITAGREHANMYLDTVVVRVGRALISFSFQSQIRPYDRDQSEHVVSILVERVTEAVAEED